MSTSPSIDFSATALLLMDLQNEIIDTVAEELRVPLIEKAAMLLAWARKRKLPVIYVTVQFRAGYPEISANNKQFSGLKTAGRLLEGTPAAQIHPRLAPLPGELVLVKRRVGAFSSTELEVLLSGAGARTLVLAGMWTSGVVLSTLRYAADKDYELIVVENACADPDPDVHQVLVEKVFPWQATVIRAEDLVRT
jgi:nicotinamidase-related amidase